jgi:hypothetical protein
MLKLLSSGLAIVAGMVCSSAPISPFQTQRTPSSDYRNDPRLHAIQSFFAKTDCPVKEFSHVFLEAADAYALDWRLLPSICFVESTGGKAARHNNYFGWDSGRAKFPSPSAAIHTVGYQLAHNICYRRKNLDQVLEIYNPVGNYPERVKAIMRQIAPRE